MTKDKDGICVDAEIQLAINEGNDRVIDSLSSNFNKQISKLTSDIERYVDLLHKPLRTDVDRLRNDIVDLYEKLRTLTDRLAHLESRQSTDEGNRSGRDRGTDVGFQAKQTSWGVVAAVAGIFGTIVGLLVYFI